MVDIKEQMSGISFSKPIQTLQETMTVYLFAHLIAPGQVQFHDETQRGLSGSTFKECGAVDSAFLSYLNVITKANSLLEIPRR